MIKNYNITVNGKSYEVEVEEVGIYNEPVTRPNVAQSAPRQQAPKAVQKTSKAPVQSGGASSIQAPMPGTINDIKVKVGDSVKKGQVLLILEAMKMENEIYAGSDGTVSAVNVSKGASVSVGDVLITLG